MIKWPYRRVGLEALSDHSDITDGADHLLLRPELSEMKQAEQNIWVTDIRLMSLTKHNYFFKQIEAAVPHHGYSLSNKTVVQFRAHTLL